MKWMCGDLEVVIGQCLLSAAYRFKHALTFNGYCTLFTPSRFLDLGQRQCL